MNYNFGMRAATWFATELSGKNFVDRPESYSATHSKCIIIA